MKTAPISGLSLGGGGGVNSAGQLTVTGSIFSGNTANGKIAGERWFAAPALQPAT